jgi:antitoxin HigA-1
MSIEQVESQQSFLHAAKAELGMTWDALAVAAGIEPRALKNYRMPSGSQNHRGMPKLARRAIEQLLLAHERKIARRRHNMTRMHNPPHPGEVLREYLGDITVTDAAEKLGVNRVTLSRVVTGSSGVSADMAYRLGDAFGTSPEFWAGMQLQYDLYLAGKVQRPKIERFAV